ncbi:MAG: helix-turn-helix domain-containing protein [Pseudomonadota bacterium]
MVQSLSVKSADAAKSGETGSLRRGRMRLVLVEAATQLFAEKGVDATTIDEIVVRAGVAKGTFYNYFIDRSAIAVAVAARIRHELNAAVGVINSAIEDPAERVVRGVRLFMALAVFDPVHARMLARLYEGSGQVEASSNNHLKSDLEDGLRSGRFHVPSLEVALHIVIGLATIAMRHILTSGIGSEIARGEGYARDLSHALLQALGLGAADIAAILDKPFSLDGVQLIGPSVLPVMGIQGTRK